MRFKSRNINTPPIAVAGSSRPGMGVSMGMSMGASQVMSGMGAFGVQPAPGAGGVGGVSGSAPTPVPTQQVRKVMKKDVLFYCEQDPFFKNTDLFFKTSIGIRLKPSQVT